MPQKIPTTVITGFLGAGKTTLIRNLLAQNGGKRIALIINEFGDIGVDAEVLRGCGDALCAADGEAVDIIELSNGCICCTVADDFVPTMKQLLDRDAPPDHIVIETSTGSSTTSTPSSIRSRTRSTQNWWMAHPCDSMSSGSFSIPMCWGVTKRSWYQRGFPSAKSR